MAKTTLRLVILLGLVMLLPAGCVRSQFSAAIPEKTTTEDFEPFRAPFVEEVLFGYWEAEPLTSNWIETTRIPARPGLRFGWRIKLKEPYGEHVQITERMIAPASPRTWGELEERYWVSSDRLVATVPNWLKVRDGWLYRANWMVSEGDPLGSWRLDVQINSAMALRLAFELVTADAYQGAPEEPLYEDEDPAPETEETPAGDDPESH